MLEYVLVAATAFFASLISFYSGFGLGTILMPVMAIFLPLPIAIAFTAVVHLLYNLVRTGLLWNAIDGKIAIRFGSAAILASIPGALLLQQLSQLAPVKQYSLGEISWLHVCIGVLLIFCATIELFPKEKYGIKNLFLGGAISGFFGGLSGHQGAFRSLFLVNAHLDKKSFIGTNAIIAAVVDVIRLVIYGFSFAYSQQYAILITAVIAAVSGLFLGMFLLKTITIEFIQKTIVALLYALGTLLILGIV